MNSKSGNGRQRKGLPSLRSLMMATVSQVGPLGIEMAMLAHLGAH